MDDSLALAGEEPSVGNENYEAREGGSTEKLSHGDNSEDELHFHNSADCLNSELRREAKYRL